MTRASLLLALALHAFAMTYSIHASADASLEMEKLVAEAAKALDEGRPNEAIRTLEAAADRGATHPDLSFNRGVGYLHRGTGTTSEPGDLGQAAAAFAEALHLRPGDKEAARGLEKAQLLAAQKKQQKGASSENLSLGLVERLLLALAPVVLLMLGALGCAILTGGLIARRSQSESTQVGGGIAVIVGMVLFLPSFGLHRARAALFDDARVAVVILDGTEILVEGGARLAGRAPLREGTVVYIHPPEYGLARLVNFADRGHVSLGRLRLLAEPPR